MADGRLTRFDFLHAEVSAKRDSSTWRRLTKIALATAFAGVSVFCVVLAPSVLNRPATISSPVRIATHSLHRVFTIVPPKRLPRATRTAFAPRFAVPSKPPAGAHAYRVRAATVLVRFRRVETPAPRPEPAARVVAIAVGGRPHAIVSVNGDTRIVTIGSLIGGRRITAITLEGVRFAGAGPALHVAR